MGRWGCTVFQGDSDLDIVSELEEIVGVSILDEQEKLAEAREKLNAGLGAELFAQCRDKEKESGAFDFFDPRYTTLILGAYMMQVGANISPEDRQHLNDIFPKIPSRNGYVLPTGDDGLREPGQVQYQAALENYVNGTRRNFYDASCFNCGKISQDLAPVKLKICVVCDKDNKTASYCNRECQKENWKKHKAICGRPKGNGSFQMLNV